MNPNHFQNRAITKAIVEPTSTAASVSNLASLSCRWNSSGFKASTRKKARLGSDPREPLPSLSGAVRLRAYVINGSTVFLLVRAEAMNATHVNAQRVEVGSSLFDAWLLLAVQEHDFERWKVLRRG